MHVAYEFNMLQANLSIIGTEHVESNGDAFNLHSGVPNSNLARGVDYPY
jgi:hypothetical protein